MTIDGSGSDRKTGPVKHPDLGESRLVNQAPIRRPNHHHPNIEKATKYYADKMEIPPRPDLGNNVWKYLRQKYEPYLKEAWEIDSVTNYVPDATRAEIAVVASSARRHIELEVDRHALDETIQFVIRGADVELASVRWTAATVLKRLAYAHLDQNSLYVFDIFEAARKLFIRGIEREFVIERALASEIFAYTNPFVPDDYLWAIDMAPMLRKLAEQQRNDALAHCHAYYGLVHCLSSAPTEVLNGIKTFGDLAVDGKTADIRKVAGSIRVKLSELKGPLGGGTAMLKMSLAKV